MISEKDKLNFRAFYNDVPQVQLCANVDVDWTCDLPTRFQNYTLGEDHIFSPTLINSFHLSYVRSAFGSIAKKDFSLTGLGLPVSTANYQYRLWTDAGIDAGHLRLRDGRYGRSDPRHHAHDAHQRHSLVESWRTLSQLRL